MLVLTRKKEESIMIGDDVEITIVDIDGDNVRLSIIMERFAITLSLSQQNKGKWDERDEKHKSIIIGDDVKIIIVNVCRDLVRLGSDAADVIPVHRREIYDANQRKKSAAKEKTAAEDSEDENEEVIP